jgi:beta-galactosidase
MTNAESVALFLNGESLGQKERLPFNYVEWEVPYQPGRLEAVAYRGENEIARAVVETAGKPVALRLEPDRDSLQGDGLDAVPVTVSVVDAEGRVVPDADHAVVFSVSGPAEDIGHGNGDHRLPRSRARGDPAGVPWSGPVDRPFSHWKRAGNDSC